MRLRDLRIGYVPYSEKLDHPADRRRFPYYAGKRNIKFEFADPSETYDLVYVSQSGDLTVWSEYQKGNAKVIYDFIDSYLAIPRSNLKGIFRGLAKYVSGQHRYLRWDHWKALEAMCQRADAVVCSTSEQRQDILKFCQNVQIIIDIKSMYDQVKTDYSTGEYINLVWEGVPSTLPAFQEIREVLSYLKTKHKIALHLVTALQYGQFAMGKFGKRNTADLVRDLFDFDEIYLYQWHEQLCSHIMSACDLAVIPIFPDDPLYWGKPEDKLLILWRMGLPTIVSPTPAHLRAMEGAGLSMACGTQQEWIETLEHYMGDESAREEAGKKGRAFSLEYNSDEKILKQWDDLFSSVIS
ncbi:MAG: hypothetical protein HN426_11840 [Nitrospina sp.]|nr:hypothetical protein [Nitrospina sp.]MBT7936292.1 hypothetical protein [Nitrospina sp.]